MKETWSILMLVSGGLLAGAMIPIALERGPTWRSLDPGTYRVQFGDTLRRVDRLVPGLLVVCLATTIGFAVTVTGTPRTLAIIAAVLLALVFGGSGGVLVPLQKRLADVRVQMSTADVERLRARWQTGHALRTLVATSAFVLLAAAAVV